MTKKKTHALSILLLKDHITCFDDAVKDPLNASLSISLDGCDAKLFYKSTPTHPPTWARLFAPVATTELSELKNAGAAAVLLIKTQTNYFAITFGYGKSLLQPDCFEENFGLKVVLNSVDPDKIRSVDAQSLDAVPIHARTQASVATNISEFGLTEQDLVYAATGKPTDDNLGKQITGKDTLKLTLPITLEEIPKLLNKLITAYGSKRYEENFKWVDQLCEVRTQSTIDQLNDSLVKKITSGDLSTTWLATPDIIDWSGIGTFRYKKPTQGADHADIGWETYLATIDKKSPLTLKALKEQRIYAISSTSDKPAHEWPVFKCIYCELKQGGHTFALTAGRWYQVDQDFLTSIDNIIRNIPISSISLPSYHDKDEKTYNLRASQEDPTLAFVDCKNIAHGGRRSKIEFCDLYSEPKQMIHVKRYGGSSVLSHLFSQGYVSATLLLSDHVFREKVNTKLPSTHQLPTRDEDLKASDYEVIYAIISNSKTSSLDLPLFSKITLRNNYNQIKLMGMKASIKVIPVEDKKT